MPDSRPEDRNRLHELTLNNPAKDFRYTKGITNIDKVAFICGVIAHPREAFDLDIPFPVEDWMVSDDNSVICAGLYLSDLRVTFYKALLVAKGGAPDETLFTRLAEAEYWSRVFNVLVNRRINAILLQDTRVLH